MPTTETGDNEPYSAVEKLILTLSTIALVALSAWAFPSILLFWTP